MPKYRKIKPGWFWPRKPGLPQRIDKGDIIECDAKLLGSHIVEFELVKDGEEEEGKEETELPPSKLRVIARGGGYYNVVDPGTGETVNETPLKKEEAEQLASQGRKNSRVDQSAGA